MNPVKKNKPELLLPVGNIESFYAAINGGADAIYFGLKNFNARNRAMNFTPWQAAAMVREARKKNIRSYITLNTVIRNFELNSLIDTLHQIQQIGPDAVIIQDLGVLYIIKKYFPGLKIHASTQMAIHNSEGMKYADNKGIERVVLARELTMSEIEEITRKTDIETELFVHGALCYSFSGMCLFSSYLGGYGANRGLCTQPCRRLYSQKANDKKSTGYIFSLKDNQLIDYIEDIKRLDVSSLKIEGRLKSADYITRVSEAYRLAIDYPQKTEEAKRMLENDLGRDKTSYFIGRDVSNSITQNATAGVFIGSVVKSVDKITFTSKVELEEGCRLRFRNPQNDKIVDIKTDKLFMQDGFYQIDGDIKEVKQTYEVYLAGNKMKLPQKINTDNIQLKEHYSPVKAKQITDSLRFKGNPSQREIYVRIDSLELLKKLNHKDFNGIILQLTNDEWEEFRTKHSDFKSCKEKIIIEFPKFIPEKNISFYKDLAGNLFKLGFETYSISHISQKLLLPGGAKIISNENVYAFNDAALKLLKEEGVRNYIYPVENDIANLGKGTDRNGIVSMYLHPHLFYSRMPVKLEREIVFSDTAGERFEKHIKDGITIITSDKAVSLTQYREKLERFGFRKFLIDLSLENPDNEKIKLIYDSLIKSESIKGSVAFNFKRELK